jgi:hypothetical protein
MKFAMKSLLVVSMMAAAGVASARAVTFNAGSTITAFDPAGSGRSVDFVVSTASSGLLTFSNLSPDFAQPFPRYDPSDSNTIGGLVGELNNSDVVVTGLAGTTYTETFADDGTRGTGTAAGDVTKVTADDQTGQILSIATSMGVSLTAPVKSGASTGGTASVSNLRVDLINHAIYADLVGTNAATKTKPVTTVTLNDQALWSFASITGPTSINPKSLTAADPVAAMIADGYTNVQATPDNRGGHHAATAVYAVTGLSPFRGTTDVAFNFFVNSLGLTFNSKQGLASLPDWGRMDLSVQVSFGNTWAVSELPEPSTYALMGMGLLGVAAVARRRTK